MARDGQCYYTGRTGYKCEKCPLYEQEFCGNYTKKNPFMKSPTHPARVNEKSSLLKMLLTGSLGLKEV